jgi:hypothetical protein
MHGELLTTPSSETLATTLIQRLSPLRDSLTSEWRKHTVAHIAVDDLLPTASAHWLCEAFPPEGKLQRMRSLSKNVHVTRSLKPLSEPLEELMSALQAPTIARLLGEIIGVRDLEPDYSLDASGLVSLGRGGFENPHLEASHNARGDKYCVLKAIYYLTPDWRLADGGQLELWEDGLDRLPTVTLAKFNRLTLVAMHERSWHSVNPVNAKRARRALVHTYYASEPLAKREYKHGLSFRGRPDQSLRDLVLRYSQSLPDAVTRTLLM